MVSKVVSSTLKSRNTAVTATIKSRDITDVAVPISIIRWGGNPSLRASPIANPTKPKIKRKIIVGTVLSTMPPNNAEVTATKIPGLIPCR
jgi:hypothetical protein